MPLGRASIILLTFATIAVVTCAALKSKNTVASSYETFQKSMYIIARRGNQRRADNDASVETLTTSLSSPLPNPCGPPFNPAIHSNCHDTANMCCDQCTYAGASDTTKTKDFCENVWPDDNSWSSNPNGVVIKYDPIDNSVSDMTVTLNFATGIKVKYTVNGVEKDLQSNVPSDAIALTEGLTVPIIITVIAKDGVTTNTYRLEATRAPSTVNELSGLIVSSPGAAALAPSFDGRAGYTVTGIVNSDTVVKLKATATNALIKGISMGVVGAAIVGTYSSGQQSGEIPIGEGVDTVIEVKVTAQSGAVRTYTVTVSRPPSTNADLTNLVISPGSLNSVFRSVDPDYSSAQAFGTGSVTVTPTASNANYQVISVTANSNPAHSESVPSQQPSSGIPIVSGATVTITVTITAQGGNQKAYTIDVTEALSDDATLGTLLCAPTSGVLAPPFSPLGGNPQLINGLSYPTHRFVCTVTNSISSVAVTPTLSHASASLTVDATSLASGVTSSPKALTVATPVLFAILVMAHDGTTQRLYQVTFVRESDTDSRLIDLVISKPSPAPGYTVAMSPAPPFKASYCTAPNPACTASVPHQIDTVVVTATLSSTVTNPAPQITISLNSNTKSVASTVPSPPFSLVENVQNQITVHVAAQGGSPTQDYIVSIARDASSDVTLMLLDLEYGVLTPALDQTGGRTSYSTTVGNEKTRNRVTVKPTHSQASVKYYTDYNGPSAPGDALSGSTSPWFDLLEGGTTKLTVLVTAQDKTTTKEYTISIARAENTESRIKTCQVSNDMYCAAYSTSCQASCGSGSSVDQCMLQGDWNKNDHSYQVTMPNAATGIQMVCIPKETTHATMKIDDGSGYVALPSHEFSSFTAVPEAGTVTLRIEGIAQATSSTTLYTVTVSRTASSVATLDALTISHGTLTPAFASGTTTYDVNDVANSVTEVTVSATLTHFGASLTVGSNHVTPAPTPPGVASAPQALTEGGTTAISVKVTSHLGPASTKTYTIHVFRPLPDAVLLQGLTAQLSDGTAGILSPTFAPNDPAYRIELMNSISWTTLTPSAKYPASCTIQISEAMSGAWYSIVSGQPSSQLPIGEGETRVYTIKVTSSSTAAVGEYTVTVSRPPSTDSSLSELLVHNGDTAAQIPTTDNGEIGGLIVHTASVANDVVQVTITPIASQMNATITVQGQSCLSGTPSQPIQLQEGSTTTISVIVTPQLTTAPKTQYSVRITRAESEDATLALLEPSTHPTHSIVPVFNKSTEDYTLDVPNSESNLFFKVRASHPKATVSVHGHNLGTYEGTQPTIDLAEGAYTVVRIVITAQKSSVTQTYTVTIWRPPSSDSKLSCLRIKNPGELVYTPTFKSSELFYTTAVAFETTEQQVKLCFHQHATCTVNGVNYTDYTGSVFSQPAVPLVVNQATAIVMRVTSQDGSNTTEYILNTTRQLSTNALLSDLALGPTAAHGVIVDFKQNIYSYSTSVAHEINYTQVTATVAQAGSTIHVKGQATAFQSVPNMQPSHDLHLYAAMSERITVRVTAPNGQDTATYFINVFRTGSANALLINLTSTGNQLLPDPFESTRDTYSMTLPNTISSFSLTPTAADTTASIKVDNRACTSGQPSASLTPTTGQTKIFRVKVTAQDGTTNEQYKVLVTQDASSDASLLDLVVHSPSGASSALQPTFSPSHPTYQVFLGEHETHVRFKATINPHFATATLNGVNVVSGSAQVAPGLAVPSGTAVSAVFEVTAQDKITTKIYNVTIQRALSTDSSLASLEVCAGIACVTVAITPSFPSTKHEYTAEFANEYEQCRVKAGLSDASAVLSVDSDPVAGGQWSNPALVYEGQTTQRVLKVSAQNVVYSTKYKVDCQRAGSTDATLKDLQVRQNGTQTSLSLVETFDSTLLVYTVTVAADVAAVQVAAWVNATTNTATHINIPAATVTIAGESTANGVYGPSGGVALGYGTTVVQVVVTPQAGPAYNPITYEVYVSRPLPDTLLLTDLIAEAAPASGVLQTQTLVPTFAEQTTMYTVTVLESIETIGLRPTVKDPASSCTVAGITTSSGALSSPLLAVPAGGFLDIPVVITSIAPATGAYIVHVVRPKSENANLGSLELTENDGPTPLIGYTPVFDATTLAYTATVPYTIDRTKVAAVPQQANASVAIQGIVLASSQHGVLQGPYPLASNAHTVIKVLVTSQSTLGAKLYRVTVFRQPNSDARLLNLTVSTAPAHALVPGFEPGTVSYAITVPNGVPSMYLTPTAAAEATVTVQGQAVASGQASPSVALLEGGTTVIDVVVTAQDGSTRKTYQVRVSRASSTEASALIEVTSGSLVPASSGTTFAYNVTVPFVVGDVQLRVTPSGYNATVDVDGSSTLPGAWSSPATPLTAGVPRPIVAVVTAQAGAPSLSYTVTVLRLLNPEAHLTDIWLHNVSVPGFDKAILDYSITVPNSVAEMVLTPFTNVFGASIDVEGSTVQSGSPGSPIALPSGGTKTIQVRVVSQDSLKTVFYTVTITREPSADCTLMMLTASSGMLQPAFSTGIHNYEVVVSRRGLQGPPAQGHAAAAAGHVPGRRAVSITSLALAPTVTNKLSSVVVRGQPVYSGQFSRSYTLVQTEINYFPVVVLAQDNVTNCSYMVAVRHASYVPTPGPTLAPAAPSVAPTASGGGADAGGEVDDCVCDGSTLFSQCFECPGPWLALTIFILLLLLLCLILCMLLLIFQPWLKKDPEKAPLSKDSGDEDIDVEPWSGMPTPAVLVEVRSAMCDIPNPSFLDARDASAGFGGFLDEGTTYGES